MAKKADGYPRGGKVLRCSRGYKFKKIGRNKVALMRLSSVKATFTCECSSSGGCKVEIRGGTADCLESGCQGACGWIVNLPGIRGKATWLARPRPSPE